MDAISDRVERAGDEPDVTLDLADAAAIEAAFSGVTDRHDRLLLGEDEVLEVVRGQKGDRLLSYGAHAEFYIGAGGSPVLCAPADARALGWQRVLLDSVLGTAALARGHEALHAAAVELDQGVVAISSPSGGGKSTLCAELILRGARLFADDLVFLTRHDGGVLAHPGPPLMNLARARAEQLGTLAEILPLDAGEVWVAVRESCQEPAPLRAVVSLERRRGAEPARIEISDSPVQLLGMALHGVDEGERQRTRFELIADLTGQATVFRLVADTSTPPDVLAGLIESAVRGPAAG